MTQRLLKAAQRLQSGPISAFSLLKPVLKSTNSPIPRSWDLPDTALHLQIPVSSEEESTLQAYFSMYRAGKGPLYVQVEFSPVATADYADFRSLSLCLTCGCAWLPLNSGTVVVKAEAEDFSKQGKEALLGKIRREIEALVGEKVTFSADIQHLDAAKAAGAGQMLATFSPFPVKSVPQTTLLYSFSPLQSQLLSYLPRDCLRPVAATEASGGTRNAQGIDVDLLMKHYLEHGTVKGFDGGETFNSLGKADFRPDVIIAGNEWTNVLSAPKLLLELSSCVLSPEIEQNLLSFGTLILPSQLCNIGEAVAGFAAAIGKSRKIPEAVYKQWTTWMGIKQVQSLEALIHTSGTHSAYKERLVSAVETVCAATAFRIGWKQTKEGGSLREMAVSTALAYLSRPNNP